MARIRTLEDLIATKKNSKSKKPGFSRRFGRFASRRNIAIPRDITVDRNAPPRKRIPYKMIAFTLLGVLIGGGIVTLVSWFVSGYEWLNQEVFRPETSSPPVPLIIDINATTSKPSRSSTESPSLAPSLIPSTSPSASAAPSTSAQPSGKPTITPVPTASMTPSISPSISHLPSLRPTEAPSVSVFPSVVPSSNPTGNPSTSPYLRESDAPSLISATIAPSSVSLPTPFSMESDTESPSNAPSEMALTPSPTATPPLLPVTESPSIRFATPPPMDGSPTILISASFDVGTDGFVYRDDIFRSTSQPDYADGQQIDNFLSDTRGSLRVALGGVDDKAVSAGMSGGWERLFTLNEPSHVELSFRMRVSQTRGFATQSVSQGLLSVDGFLLGQAPFDMVTQVVGNGDSKTSEWKEFSFHLGELSAGDHIIVLGGHASEKLTRSTVSEILVDDVIMLRTSPPEDPSVKAHSLVDQLDYTVFKENIRILADFGDREQGTVSYLFAEAWAQQELESFGYTVETHEYDFGGITRRNFYATKVGNKFPDRMFIVSAHLDGSGEGGSADDNASGCSLLLEMARVFGTATVATDISVRFVFWNNGETGQQGSSAYTEDRESLQGQESVSRFGQFDEPTWLGMISCDTVLFDHGIPPAVDQRLDAELNIEFDGLSFSVLQSLQLASALQRGNAVYSESYPAEIKSGMRGTDSVPFKDFTAATSIQENDWFSLNNGSNPHRGKATDLYGTFSEQDFLFGFDALKMTTGGIALLVST